MAPAPDNLVVLRNLAGAYQKLNRTEEAAGVLEKAIAIEPTARAYTSLGSLRFFQGKYLEAVPLMEKAVELSPNNYTHWGNLADAYWWTPGNREKARDSYRRALQLGREAQKTNATDVDLRSLLAVYAAKSGDKAAAIDEAEAILAMPSDRQKPGALFVCAVAFEVAGFRNRALQALEAAVQSGYSLQETGTDPDLVSLRADQRYHVLMAKAEKAVAAR